LPEAVARTENHPQVPRLSSLLPARSPIHLLAILVVIVSTITQYEATRILLDDQEGGRGPGRGVVWTRNVNILLLSSLQWRRVSPPSPHPATNKNSSGNDRITPSMISQGNFASLKT
ncbi:hypothetical protein HAX54_043163, partial [Datura stramonium]|nr:hypothetical protein [Datura stramonium]